jgi:PAS domain S-box-containing protein
LKRPERSVEAALEASEERFQMLVEGVKDYAIFMLDPQGHIVSWNGGAERMKGYQAEEIIGRHFSVFYTEVDQERGYPEEKLRIATAEGIYEEEGLRVRKDGSKFWASVLITALRNEEGKLRGFAKVVRDVTERKRAEEEVRHLNEELEERVVERTARLEATVAELRASEERYRLLVESTEDYAIFMVDRDGRVADWNVGAERIFGYREEEIVGELSSLLFTPEDRRRGAPEEELRQAVAEGRAEDERWHIRKDGTRFWASGVMTSVRDAEGNLRGFAKVARDITERKEAVRRLREAETRYRTLVEQIPAITYVQEPVESSRPKAVTYMSPQYETMLGYPPETEMIDEEHWLSTIHPEDRKRVLSEETRTDQSGEPFEVEYRIIARDGRVVWVRDHAVLVRDEEGHPLYWLGVQYDITEQKRFEETLRESEERYRAVVEQAAEGILLIDVDSKRILEANPAYMNLLGYAPEEILGLTLYDLVPYSRENMDCYIERVQEQRSYVSGERRHRRKDGSLVDVEVSANLITFGGRKAVCMVVHDITERKRAEGALREVREAERRRLARDLHDGVLQDLSYSTAAMGLIMLEAEGTGLEEQLQSAIDAARGAAQGLRAAVNDLRLEDERDHPFTEVVQSLVQRNRAMARGCEISLEVGKRFPSTPLGDAGTEVLRVIQEALTNARRHSGAPNVWVSLRVEGDELVAEVSDDGRGFGSDIASGVGFSSMSERAAAIGGKVEIESAVGQGTRVHLRVPVPQKG